LRILRNWAGGIAHSSVVKGFPSMLKALGSIPSTTKRKKKKKKKKKKGGRKELTRFFPQEHHIANNHQHNQVIFTLINVQYFISGGGRFMIVSNLSVNYILLFVVVISIT
jgi:hypothetical protein